MALNASAPNRWLDGSLLVDSFFGSKLACVTKGTEGLNFRQRDTRSWTGPGLSLTQLHQCRDLARASGYARYTFGLAGRGRSGQTGANSSATAGGTGKMVGFAGRSPRPALTDPRMSSISRVCTGSDQLE